MCPPAPDLISLIIFIYSSYFLAVNPFVFTPVNVLCKYASCDVHKTSPLVPTLKAAKICPAKDVENYVINLQLLLYPQDEHRSRLPAMEGSVDHACNTDSSFQVP